MAVFRNQFYLEHYLKSNSNNSRDQNKPNMKCIKRDNPFWTAVVSVLTIPLWEGPSIYRII